jgi:magnesium chelatase family protein
MDRIDIHIQVPRVEYEKLASSRTGEPSSVIQARVETARDIQRKRFSSPQGGFANGVTCNADMRPAEVRKYCELDEAGKNLMKSASLQLQLSARAYHRVLKLSRTIADLAGCEQIVSSHLAEALQYRPRLMENG